MTPIGDCIHKLGSAVQTPLWRTSTYRPLHLPCIGQRTARRNGQLLQTRVAETVSRTEPPSLTSSSLESSVDMDELPATGSMPAPQPSSLFARSHIERWTPQLLLYFPFGCVLAALRFALWIGCIALDAPWFRHRPVIDAYLALLGFSVKWEGEEHIPSQRHVLVSNHITTGDLMILYQRPQRYAHLITTGLPKRVFGSFNLPVFLLPACKETYAVLADAHATADGNSPSAASERCNGVASTGSNDSDSSSTAGDNGSNNSAASSSLDSSSSNGSGGSIDTDGFSQVQSMNSRNCKDVGTSGQSPSPVAAAAKLSKADATASARPAAELPPGAAQAPVHLFPEGGMTNGKGMLRFSRGFMRFAEGMPVVPVVLRCKSSSPEVNCHTLTSSFLANLFWLSFPVFTEMTAKALPAMTMEPGESKAAFVQRVQAVIADELGVGVADLNVQQKRKLAQRAAAANKRK